MNNRLYYTNLYDYYGKLLTEKQRKYFEDYYFDNLTLAEISENEDISRNAVHKQIKEVLKKLDFFEEKLKLSFKAQEIKKIIMDIDEEIKGKVEELI